MSPIWCIAGLDPHRDTPVEILHVILLGFLKYMWWDIINHQLHNNVDKKNELEIKLASVNIDGLGIDLVAAHTLVTYSGSLTGQDFRILVQITPFVLKGLVSDDCFETWVALSKLVPLVWQPEIEDINEYLTLVRNEIDYFLLCVARWTSIFADWDQPCCSQLRDSSHSMQLSMRRVFTPIDMCPPVTLGLPLPKRNLPSDDLSLRSQSTTQLPEPYQPRSFSHFCQDWTCIGQGPAHLIAGNNTASQYLGLFPKKKKKNQAGICLSDKRPPRSFANTLMGAQFPALSVFTASERDTSLFVTAKEMYLKNGDHCLLEGHVVVRNPGGGSNVVAKVVEILQRKFSVHAMSQSPDCILIAGALLSETSAHGMPQIAASGHYGVVPLSQLLCTVNVQHDCSHNACTADASVSIFEE
ncbi:hypothetical protein EDD18DRAFT_1359676 [Armillaria luteobubalina]|uniref:Uncharacterized protein n=1 Tax=Armillaria luteobubalina TaxID=153913 RepID=A0AA39UHX7_9AGAR|nr:hypothetical protein EDD18DRAFT_1359676 [Armillaria luteobubalina]